VKKIIASVGLALAFLFTLPAPAAFAHAQLVGVSPSNGSVLEEKPETLIIEYSESIKQVSSDSIFVLDANAERLEGVSFSIENSLLTINLPDDLSPGGYVAVWKVVSSDGHIVGSATTFAYGEFTPPDLESITIPGASDSQLFDPLKILFNIALFFSTAVVFAGSRRAIKILRVSALMALGLGSLSIGFLAAEYGWLSESILLGEVQSAVIKTVAAAVLFAACFLHKNRQAAGLTALVILSLSAFTYGHANGLESNNIVPILFALHLLAATIWTAGVVSLMLDPSIERARLFGRWAIPSILVLLVSSLFTAFALGWNPLNAWAWDNILTVKVAVVAIALILGLAHHISLRHVKKVSLKTLRVGFILESVLILLVAGGASSLSATPAPVFASANQVYQDTGAANEIFLADGTPISLFFSDVTSGSILNVRALTETPVDSVEILLSHEESGIFDLPVVLENEGSGTSFSSEIVWAFPGVWNAEIKVVEDAFTARLGTVDVYVVPSGTHQH